MNAEVTQKSDLPWEEIVQLAKEQEFVLLDVRTQEEVNEGTLSNALHIPVDQLEHRLGELETLRDRTILCFCKRGGRAENAANLLRDHEFSRVINIGGYDDLVGIFG